MRTITEVEKIKDIVNRYAYIDAISKMIAAAAACDWQSVSGYGYIIYKLGNDLAKDENTMNNSQATPQEASAKGTV